MDVQSVRKLGIDVDERALFSFFLNPVMLENLFLRISSYVLHLLCQQEINLRPKVCMGLLQYKIINATHPVNELLFPSQWVLRTFQQAML